MPDKDVAGKVVLITGASSGIGLSTVQFLLMAGCKVYAGVRSPGKAKELHKLIDEFRGPAKGNVQVVQLDVTDTDSVDAAVKRVVDLDGRIDVLLNIAGYALAGFMETWTVDEAKAQFDVNVWGCVRTMQAVAPLMRKQQSGHIVNFSSNSGVRATPYLDAYVASKHALEGLSESMAPLYRKWGVRVTTVQVGPVKTPISGKAVVGTRKISESPNPFEGLLASGSTFFPTLIESGMDVAEAGKSLVKLISQEAPPMRWQIGEASQKTIATVHTDPTGEQRVAAGLQMLPLVSSTKPETTGFLPEYK